MFTSCIAALSYASAHAQVQALKPLPADSAAVEACLKLAGENSEKDVQRKEQGNEAPGAGVERSGVDFEVAQISQSCGS